MPRSPLKSEAQYSQILQHMIQAKQKNTTLEALQSKIQQQF
jgi:hypothetical protein